MLRTGEAVPLKVKPLTGLESYFVAPGAKFSLPFSGRGFTVNHLDQPSKRACVL